MFATDLLAFFVQEGITFERFSSISTAEWVANRLTEGNVYLTMHSTHFIYGYMASTGVLSCLWDVAYKRTLAVNRKE